MRGTTLQDRGSTALALPNGTVANPALRLGAERTGIYLENAGRLGISVNKFLALEVTQNDTFSRSNTAGALAVPLSLTRVQPTTADNQETAIDVFQGELGSAITTGRLASYRQTTTKWGWKWYGRDGVLHGTPALTLTGDKDLIVGRDLTVTRDINMTGAAALNGNLTVRGAEINLLPVTGMATLQILPAQANQNSRIWIQANAGAQQLNLTLQGGSSAWGLGAAQGDVSLYTNAGALRVGTNSVARMTIEANGNSFFRLPSGSGTFEVRHSATGAPVFSVTDAGASTAAAGTVGNAQIISGAVDSRTIQDGAIQTVDIGNEQITDSKLANPSIIEAKYFTGSVSNRALADGAVTSAKIQDRSIVGGDLVLATIGTNEIANGAVTSGKLGGSAAVTGALGYTPVNKVGDLMTGTLEIQRAGPADAVAGWQSNHLILTSTGNTKSAMTFHRAGYAALSIYEQDGVLYSGGYKVWAANTDGNGSGLEADTLRGLVPANSPNQIPISNGTICGGLNAQYLNGQLGTYYAPDAYRVPAYMRAFYTSGAMPTGWARDTNANGRVIVGSGASGLPGGLTWGENSHHGGTWQIQHNLSSHTHPFSGNGTHAHTHGLGNTPNSGWVSGGSYIALGTETAATGSPNISVSGNTTGPSNNSTDLYTFNFPVFALVMAYKNG